MLSTKAWAELLGISVNATPPPVADYAKRCPRSARQVAVRAVILQGVVAVACDVDPDPIIDWFHQQRIGSAIDDFVASAKVQEPGVLLAEDDRTYNLWCYAQKARRKGELLEDLNWGVLYERRYTFEWLDGMQDWDEVTCDA